MDAEPPLLVWPDIVPAINVFQLMRTQWTDYGLNYAALPEVWRRAGISPKDRNPVFDDLLVMEDAGIGQINDDAAAAHRAAEMKRASS